MTMSNGFLRSSIPPDPMLPISNGTSPWADWLEEDPIGRRAAYFSFAPQFGTRSAGTTADPSRRVAAPMQRRYYENAFSRIQDEWLGQLGRQTRGVDMNGAGGGVPTKRFVDYLGELPFTEKYYASQPPSVRGTRMSQFAPRSRRLIY